MIKRYILNVLIALDQLANAVLRGDPDETLSSAAGKARNAGVRWGCILCRVLDWIDPDHCDKSIERDEGRWSLREHG